MFKKLVSILLAVTVFCSLAFTATAATAEPDFIKSMPAPEYMLFSTANDKSLDFLSVEVVIPQDFVYFSSVDSENLYGIKGDFYIQFDWSIDERSWSYTKDWNDLSYKDAITYNLGNNLIQEFDIFDITLESDKNRFSLGVKLENGKDAFYYAEHELAIRARYIFAYTDLEENKDDVIYSKWSDGFSVNDDYYNRNSHTVEIEDFGVPFIIDSISLNKGSDSILQSFMFDWFFDGTLEDVAYNLYAANGDKLRIQEQIFIGENGVWADVTTDKNADSYICGSKTVPVEKDWLSEGNYFKYRFRYYYPGDLSNGMLEFCSAWSDSIIFNDGEVSVVNETDDSASVIENETTEPVDKLDPEDNSTLVSPIVYIILIFVLLCFLFGLLTSIGETRRQRKEAMGKTDSKKEKKNKNKNKK